MTEYWLGIDKDVYLMGGLKILHIGYLTALAKTEKSTQS